MAYKVLFADNSKMINEVMKFAFETKDFEAEFAGSYAQILAKIKHNKYDLIIIDIDLNGLSVVDKIRSLELNKNTEIFFLSKNSDVETKKTAKENGVSGWIVKPFIPEKLVKTIKLHLKRYISKS